MTWLENMLDKLTGAYNNNPKSLIGKLFSLLAWGFQKLEDCLTRIQLWHNLHDAKGKTLDRIGHNFGVLRGAADDKTYRIMIMSKISSLLSGGDVNTIIRTVAAMFDVPEASVEVTELFPAKIRVTLDQDDIGGSDSVYEDAVAAAIKRMSAAGIGSKLLIKIYKRLEIRPILRTVCSNHDRTKITPYVSQKRLTASYKSYAAVSAIVHTQIYPAGGN